MTLVQKPVERLFAVTAPGLAPFTAQELRQLGLLPAVPAGRPSALDGRPRAADEEHGGVEFSGDRRALYLANLHLRTANRVLLRLGEFEAVGFTDSAGAPPACPGSATWRPANPWRCG